MNRVAEFFGVLVSLIIFLILASVLFLLQAPYLIPVHGIWGVVLLIIAAVGDIAFTRWLVKSVNKKIADKTT